MGEPMGEEVKEMLRRRRLQRPALCRLEAVDALVACDHLEEFGGLTPPGSRPLDFGPWLADRGFEVRYLRRVPAAFEDALRGRLHHRYAYVHSRVGPAGNAAIVTIMRACFEAAALARVFNFLGLGGSIGAATAEPYYRVRRGDPCWGEAVASGRRFRACRAGPPTGPSAGPA